MTKKILIAIGIVIAIVIIIVILRSPEDDWICQNGQWVKHGNPSASMPTEGCGTPAQEPEIVVTSPQPNQTVTSPLTVEGLVKGGAWFFEGSFPIKILDANGQEIAASFVQAQGDWMTTNPVKFKGEIRFISPANGNGTLLLKNDNPSDRRDLDKEFRVPIKLAPTE